MGLVANVDDRVVLTVQAAVNYLTKYVGKLGGGQSATSRISSCIDEIICKMPDDKEMTVTSLLSKLFIHAAVPQEFSSLEAWHVLMDLPRVLSSRQIVVLNAKDTMAFKDLQEIERAGQDQQATRPTKADLYMSRMKSQRADSLSAEKLQQMSWAKFFGSVDRGGRGQRLSLRSKSSVVKEKPFLQLDARRRDAAAMARLCLRLQRKKIPCFCPTEAMRQLRCFALSARCPVWLRKRYARHNRPEKKSHAGAEPQTAAASGLAVSGGLAGADPRSAQEQTSSSAAAAHAAAAADTRGESAGVPDFVELAAGQRSVPRLRASMRILWSAPRHDLRYSVEQCLKDACARPRARPLRAYLAALGVKPEPGAKAPSLARTFVLAVLWFDLQPYRKRGPAFSKPNLKVKQLKELLDAYFAAHPRDFTDKVKKRMKEKPYVEMWNEVKRLTLSVGSDGRAASSRLLGVA